MTPNKRGKMSTAIVRGAPASGQTDSGLRGSPAVRWWVLVVLGMAQLMVMLDATVVTIALPEAQQDLGFSDGSGSSRGTPWRSAACCCSAADSVTWWADAPSS